MIRMIFIFQSPDGMAQSSVMGSPSMAFLRKFERSFEARLCCPQNGSVPSSTAATRIDIRGTSLWDGHHNHSMIQPFDERNMIWYKLCYMNIYIYESRNSRITIDMLCYDKCDNFLMVYTQKSPVCVFPSLPFSLQPCGWSLRSSGLPVCLDLDGNSSADSWDNWGTYSRKMEVLMGKP
jgi:hypothetical protein